MISYLIDTNVLSAMRRPNRLDPAPQRWFLDNPHTTLALSCVTVMETAHGVLSKHTKDPAQGRTLQAWLDRILLDFVDRIYPFTLDTALTAARISQGRTRGRADLLIAATAIAHDLPLATRNVRDFYDIPGLVVVNPWEHNPHDPAT